MKIERKLAILAQAAKYDRVCGKGKERNSKKSTAQRYEGLYFLQPLCQRRYMPLLKVLLRIIASMTACIVTTGALTI